jgi:hypothetical protein
MSGWSIVLKKTTFITHYVGDTQRSSQVKSRYCISDTVLDIPELSRDDFQIGARFGNYDFLHRDGDYWDIVAKRHSPISQMGEEDFANLVVDAVDVSLFNQAGVEIYFDRLPRYSPGSNIRYNQRDSMEAMMRAHFSENVCILEDRLFHRTLPPFIFAIERLMEKRWHFVFETGVSTIARRLPLLGIAIRPAQASIVDATGEMLTQTNCSLETLNFMNNLVIFIDDGYQRLNQASLLSLAGDVLVSLKNLQNVSNFTAGHCRKLIRAIKNNLFMPVPLMNEETFDQLYEACYEAVLTFGEHMYDGDKMVVVQKSIQYWQDRPVFIGSDPITTPSPVNK